MKMKTVGVHFGALSKTVTEQLKEQDCKFDKKEVKLIEELIRATLLLWFNDVIPTGVKNKIFDKLHRRIIKSIKQ